MHPEGGLISLLILKINMGFPGDSVVKSLPASIGSAGDRGSIPGSERFPCRRKWQPAPVFLPRKSHGQRNLLGYSTWGPKVRHDLATEHSSQKKFSSMCGSHYISIG